LVGYAPQMPRKRRSVGQTIGGIVAGIDQQIFRTTPPADELVAKGAPNRPVAASGGGTIAIDLPEERDGTSGSSRFTMRAPGVEAVVDLDAGGRLASFVVDDRELLVTDGYGSMSWGSFPMVPFAGRVRDGRFAFRGRQYELPTAMPPHAIHGTVLARRWERVDERTIETSLGATWPFAGRAVQRFELVAGRFTSRLELHADEPMPASIGWHPWFLRHPLATGSANPGPEPGSLELELDAGAMLHRDASGMTTLERISPPPPGPWDDCFADLRRPPRLWWPGFLELTIESDCPTWVVYTIPTDAMCVEPQSAPPDALNTGPAIVEPGHPLVAEMVWTWRSIAT
jgi:aldose 1-epimerase